MLRNWVFWPCFHNGIITGLGLSEKELLSVRSCGSHSRKARIWVLLKQGTFIPLSFYPFPNIHIYVCRFLFYFEIFHFFKRGFSSTYTLWSIRFLGNRIIKDNKRFWDIFFPKHRCDITQPHQKHHHRYIFRWYMLWLIEKKSPSLSFFKVWTLYPDDMSRQYSWRNHRNEKNSWAIPDLATVSESVNSEQGGHSLEPEGTLIWTLISFTLH